MMARVTEIHQILFLSPDFRFSHNVGIPAEIIQSRATKIGSRVELRKKRMVGWDVGGETIQGLTTVLAPSHRHASQRLQNFGSYPHRDSFVCDLFSNEHFV